MAIGSLLGKADTTLVQAAYRASAAGAPPDLSGIHERLAQAHSKTMKSIGDAWVQGIGAAMKVGGHLIRQAKERGDRYDAMDAYKKAEYDAVPEAKYEQLRIKESDEFPNLIEEAEVSPSIEQKYAEHTDINGNTVPVEYKTIREQLKDIRQEMISLGAFGDSELSKEEKKQRKSELRNKRENLKKSSFEFQSYKNVMKEQLNLNNVDFASSDPNKMQFARALLAEGKPLGENAGDLAGSRAVMAFDDQGHMTFVFVDQYGRHIEDSEGNKLSIQQSNVDDLLVPKNPAIQTGIDLVTDKAKNRATGAKYGEEYDVNRVSSFVETTILDVNGFKNASNYRGVSMNSSLADSLHGVSYTTNGEPVIAPTLLSSGVFGELNNLPMSLDITKDGKVNELDFKSEENYKELVDYVLSGKDLELSKKVLQTHLTNVSSAHHQLGVGDFTAAERAKRIGDGGGGDDDSVKYFSLDQVFSGGISGAQLNSLIDKLDSGEVLVDGVVYNANPNNKSWVPVDGSDPMTGNDMLMKLKDIHSPDGYNFPTDQRFKRFQGTSTSETKLVTTKDKTAYTSDIQSYFKNLGIFDEKLNFIKSTDIIGDDNRFANRGLGRGNFAALINQTLKDNEITDKKATTNAFYPNSIKLDGVRYTFKTSDWDYDKFMKALDKIIMGSGKQKLSPPVKSI